MKYEMEAPWMQLGGKISKKRTRVVWAQTAYGTRFTQLRGKRSTEPSAYELAQRAKFKQALQQANTIMTDIDQITPYRTAWMAHIRSGNVKYHTLRGFIVAQVYKSL